MKIFVDIDETICRTPADRDYTKAEPIAQNIERVNALYDEGHTITYWTARGSVSGKDWRSLTEQQLGEWGCKYHELKLGKPAYDIFIDDKVLNARVWEQKGNDVVKRVLLQSQSVQDKIAEEADKFALAIERPVAPMKFGSSGMGIGAIGLGSNTVIKRKFRWSVKVDFENGLKIDETFVRISHRPDGDPVLLTIHDIDMKKPPQWLEGLSDVVYSSNPEATVRLTLYDGVGTALERHTLPDAVLQSISFGNLSFVEQNCDLDLIFRYKKHDQTFLHNFGGL